MRPAFETLLYAKSLLKVSCWKPKIVETIIPKKVIKIIKKILKSSIPILPKILIKGIIRKSLVKVVKNEKSVLEEAW